MAKECNSKTCDKSIAKAAATKVKTWILWQKQTLCPT